MTASARSGLLVVLLCLAMSATSVAAQDLSAAFFDDATLSSRSIQLFALVTILSLAPGIAIMVTCFPFIVTVLSILRQGLGLQQSPPNMLIVSLALFLTYYIMEPVFLAAWEGGINPYRLQEIPIETAFTETLKPFRLFMASRVDEFILSSLADLRPTGLSSGQVTDQPLSLLIPSFMLSEISLAFQIGFLISLPFLIIDLVVAAILMSMGMMMVPPAIVSLPFKLGFFVIADGWTLLSAALVRSYA